MSVWLEFGPVRATKAQQLTEKRIDLRSEVERSDLKYALPRCLWMSVRFNLDKNKGTIGVAGGE
jgi:hypothetical protein